MSKAETRELNRLELYRAAGADTGMIARSLSALIRAARTNKSAADLRAVADQWGVTRHPEFIA
jgi:protein-disulfide isomerase-like protein with CxxC motif